MDASFASWDDAFLRHLAEYAFLLYNGNNQEELVLRSKVDRLKEREIFYVA